MIPQTETWNFLDLFTDDMTHASPEQHEIHMKVL